MKTFTAILITFLSFNVSASDELPNSIKESLVLSCQDFLNVKAEPEGVYTVTCKTFYDKKISYMFKVDSQGHLLLLGKLAE